MNMMMIFADDFIDKEKNLIKICDERRLNHLQKVLKVKVDKVCKIGLLNEQIGEGKVIELNSDSIIIESKFTKTPPQKLPLTLAIAMQRPNTVKKIIHSAITLGVKEIIFFGCFKVEKSYWDSSVLQESSLYKEQILALEQAVDTKTIEINFCRYFKDFTEEILPKHKIDKELILAHPSENPNKLTNIEESLLIMGPEGGFTEYEVNRLKTLGAKQLSLGERILRTEFAFTALAGRFLR